jgi:protein-tyrosine phosphatase
MHEKSSILSQKPENILFVCLGNICRSPAAHGVFDVKLVSSGLNEVIKIDSAGTGAYHVGEKPDPRMIQAANKRGVDLSYIRARAVVPSDFETFDLILAMDDSNLKDLRLNCPEEFQHKIKLFLEFEKTSNLNSVPDPYFGGASGFEKVLDIVEQGCETLLNEIKRF